MPVRFIREFTRSIVLHFRLKFKEETKKFFPHCNEQWEENRTYIAICASTLVKRFMWIHIFLK